MYNDTRQATAEKFCKKSTYRSKDYDHSPTNDQTNDIPAVWTFSVYVSNSRLISENDEKQQVWIKSGDRTIRAVLIA